MTSTTTVDLVYQRQEFRVDMASSTYSVLLFEYDVALGDHSAGLSIPEDSFSLPTGASIKDGANNDATLDHDAHTSTYMVDGIGPAVTDIELVTSPQGDAYGPGEDVIVAVTFDDVVHVTGIPQITGRAAGSDKTLNYRVASASSTLLFGYTVATGDSGTFTVPSGTISLPSGSHHPGPRP